MAMVTTRKEVKDKNKRIQKQPLNQKKLCHPANHQGTLHPRTPTGDSKGCLLLKKVKNENYTPRLEEREKITNGRQQTVVEG